MSKYHIVGNHMLRLIYGFLLSVVKRFDYCFSENGLVAFKDGVQIGQQVFMRADSKVPSLT